MSSQKFFKNLLKLSAIVFGVLVLSLVVSAQSVIVNQTYSPANSGCPYCVTESYSQYAFTAPAYSFVYSYYYPQISAVYTAPVTANYDYGYYGNSRYYDNGYNSAVISYQDNRPPLRDWGTYYADSIGPYPYAAAYNTYSPYDNTMVSYAPVYYYYN